MKKPKAVKPCECGGRIIYQYASGMAFSFCDKCTPIQKVNVGKYYQPSRAKTKKGERGVSERERIDVGYCRRKACGRLHDNCVHTQTGDRYCEHCAIKINRANPEVPNLVTIPRLTPIGPTARDWKPVVGEKVLVEATLTHDKWHRDTVLIAVGDYMNIKVPLSSIRPRGV